LQWGCAFAQDSYAFVTSRQYAYGTQTPQLTGIIEQSNDVVVVIGIEVVVVELVVVVEVVVDVVELVVVAVVVLVVEVVVVEFVVVVTFDVVVPSGHSLWWRYSLRHSTFEKNPIFSWLIVGAVRHP
jgi:hypothetical protein